MNPRLATWLVLCPLLSGCMSSVRVYKSDSLGKPPKGIPFYVKTAVCKQETVWMEPQYVLTFGATTGNTSSGPQKILSRQQYLQETVQHFIQAPDQNTWRTKIINLPGPDLVSEDSQAAVENEEKIGNWIKVANVGAIEVVVDYGDVFYLNSARPLAGTTQVNAKLASDGTLTESSVQLQEQTLSTIATTIGSVAGAVTTAGLAGITSGVLPHVVPENHLNIATRNYKHTHTAYSGSPAKPDTCLPEPGGVFKGSFVVADVSKPATKPAAADKENVISVSGSIQLPKPAAPPSSAAPPSTTKSSPNQP